MNTKDGGPAFPTTRYLNDDVPVCVPGMSLRDYFAAKAMAAIIGNMQDTEMADLYEKKRSELDVSTTEMFSQMAYEAADAMLKAREAKQ